MFWNLLLPLTNKMSSQIKTLCQYTISHDYLSWRLLFKGNIKKLKNQGLGNQCFPGTPLLASVSTDKNFLVIYTLYQMAIVYFCFPDTHKCLYVLNMMQNCKYMSECLWKCRENQIKWFPIFPSCPAKRQYLLKRTDTKNMIFHSRVSCWNQY